MTRYLVIAFLAWGLPLGGIARADDDVAAEDALAPRAEAAEPAIDIPKDDDPGDSDAKDNNQPDAKARGEWREGRGRFDFGAQPKDRPADHDRARGHRDGHGERMHRRGASEDRGGRHARSGRGRDGNGEAHRSHRRHGPGRFAFRHHSRRGPAFGRHRSFAWHDRFGPRGRGLMAGRFNRDRRSPDRPEMPDRKAWLGRLFERLDADQDGQISRSEFEKNHFPSGRAQKERPGRRDDSLQQGGQPAKE